MSTSKEELHKMIDILPEKKVTALKHFLQVMTEERSEDSIWLSADFLDLPPYEWEKEERPQGKQVRYEPGIGLVIIKNNE